MKSFYIGILVSFIAIAILGFAGFSDDSNSAFMQCVRTIGAISCPAGSIALAVLHADIFMSFSFATLIFFLLALAVLKSQFFPTGKAKIQIVLAAKQLEEDLASDFKRILFRWFGLFEKRTQDLSA